MVVFIRHGIKKVFEPCNEREAWMKKVNETLGC